MAEHKKRSAGFLFGDLALNLRHDLWPPRRRVLGLLAILILDVRKPDTVEIGRSGRRGTRSGHAEQRHTNAKDGRLEQGHCHAGKRFPVGAALYPDLQRLRRRNLHVQCPAWEVYALEHVNAAEWVAGIYLGAAGGAIAFILWVLALARTTPTRVANTMTVNPIAASLVATKLVDEPITPNLIIGLVAVFAGIWIATTTRVHEKPRHVA